MKSILFAVLILTSNVVIAQETKTVIIYDNGITHTNIKANVTLLDGSRVKEEVYYTVTSAALWTGKLSTVIVFNGDFSQMTLFLKSVLEFAEINKRNIGANTTIEGRKVSMTKVSGFKCITIKNGDESINTNFSSVSKASKALEQWVQENKQTQHE